MTDDRALLREVAERYNQLHALQEKQRATQAEMIRACVAQLKSNNGIKRRQAIAYLEDMATMMEKPR